MSYRSSKAAHRPCVNRDISKNPCTFAVVEIGLTGGVTARPCCMGTGKAGGFELGGGFVKRRVVGGGAEYMSGLLS